MIPGHFAYALNVVCEDEAADSESMVWGVWLAPIYMLSVCVPHVGTAFYLTKEIEMNLCEASCRHSNYMYCCRNLALEGYIWDVVTRNITTYNIYTWFAYREEFALKCLLRF